MIQSILMVGAVKPGYASRNKWCLRCLLKTGNVKAEEIWVGSLFQTWHAVDEKDFEVAIDVFLNGADMVMEEEDRSDREGIYVSWKNLSKVPNTFNKYYDLSMALSS